MAQIYASSLDDDMFYHETAKKTDRFSKMEAKVESLKSVIRDKNIEIKQLKSQVRLHEDLEKKWMKQSNSWGKRHNRLYFLHCVHKKGVNFFLSILRVYATFLIFFT